MQCTFSILYALLGSLICSITLIGLQHQEKAVYVVMNVCLPWSITDRTCKVAANTTAAHGTEACQGMQQQ